MQRWLKLPDGRYIDANRIMYVGKVETGLEDHGPPSTLSLQSYV